MAFVDNLAFDLLLLGFVALLLAYLMTRIYMRYKIKIKDIRSELKPQGYRLRSWAHTYLSQAL
ncbi:MAG: hypothetical protein M1569_00170 [Candidatus Marsarchaeota archaeon]|jgi:uncharacterized membrane protein|nr:hypothetical protein [Candidatus Marsarchaeota archaeon]